MRFVIGVSLLLLGILAMLTAVIFQIILSIEMYGAIFRQVIIPHWSLWFLAGIIPYGTGHYLLSN